MSTTGNGASPGDFFGGSAAPEHSGPAAEPPPSARSERRRISERLAEAAETVDTSRHRGIPSASPWQRSNAVWHRAGIDWSRAEAGPRPPRPAAAVSAPPAATPHYPAPVPTAQPRPPAEPNAPVSPAPAGDGASADTEPWASGNKRRRLPALAGLPLRAIAIGVAVVVVIGGGAYLLFSGGDGSKSKPTGTPAVAADRLFALDPAATTGGRVHTLDGVVSAGTTAVAFGSEQGGVYSRAQFLTSADGGRTWSLAKVRAADGGDPPPGEYPEILAGGAGSWAALGNTRDGTVEWTSPDARTWTRRPLSGAFVPGDRVRRLARTASGFVAVGTATVGDATQAVMWTSSDGGTWTRLGGDRFRPPSGGTVVSLSDVAAHGDVAVVHGRVRVTRTVTRRVKRKRRKVRQTVESEAFWRSPDGGRTWEPLAVPQGQGSSGDVVGIVATQSGFFAAREASRTGRKKKRRTTAYGAFFSSPDGKNWTAAGRLELAGYSRMSLLRGTDSGLAVLVPVEGGKTAVMTSGDSRTWRRVGDLSAGRTLTGAALTPQGPVVTGRGDGGGAYLTMAGAGDVNLGAVPDAVHPERTVDGIVADAGRVLAVGSTNGRAALWTSPDGSAWTRAQLPPSRDAGQQRLVDVVHGGPGWLAVGGTGSRSLALTSADTTAWQPVSSREFGGDLVPSAAAVRGTVYVVVGTQGGTNAAAWSTSDLRRWARAADAGKNDLTGAAEAPKWMSDVAAGPAGFVAVGGQTKNKAAGPALWTSPDGRRWTLSATAPALPAGTTQGSLTKIVARGATLVATGVAGAYAFTSVSTDGGRTWQPSALPGATQGTRVTAATATPHGFVLAGTTGSDVVTWSSADGRTWHAARPNGLGLDGPGVQQLDGLTVAGTNLLAVGFTGDYRTDGPTLWRTPMP